MHRKEVSSTSRLRFTSTLHPQTRRSIHVLYQGDKSRDITDPMVLGGEPQSLRLTAVPEFSVPATDGLCVCGAHPWVQVVRVIPR